MKARSPKQSRPLRPRIGHLAAIAGCAAILQPANASAKATRPVPPPGPAFDAEPPWAGSDGSPPPLPFVRTRAAIPPAHPAVHSSAREEAPIRPLFPRASDVLDRKAERRAAMERHPAGKGIQARVPGAPTPEPGLSGADRDGATRTDAGTVVDMSTPPACNRHRVEPGETLWGIASRWSRSERPIEILRLTLEIHRLNRDTIGPDPDLILPGQVLELPERCDR